jgi:chlorophyllide a reductase subunit Y
MGPAGAGSLAEVVNGAIAGKGRMDFMKAFFEGVGHEATSGVWEDVPTLRPEFRAKYQKKLENAKKRAKREEMI